MRHILPYTTGKHQLDVEYHVACNCEAALSLFDAFLSSREILNSRPKPKSAYAAPMVTPTSNWNLRHSAHFLRDQMKKMYHEPSRLITIPLRYLISILLSLPQLVPWIIPVWPSLWVKSDGGRSLCYAIGFDLFQRDYPIEAWQWLKHPLELHRASIEERLLGANCLYQGLGRRHDAVALVSRANECGEALAVRPGLAEVPPRVLDSVWARHFGHLGLLDYVIKLGILEGRRREDTILYLPPSCPVANRFLLQQIASQLRLVENPDDLRFSPCAAQALHYDIFAPCLPDLKTVHYWKIAAETYGQWHREGRGPLFTVPADTQAQGWATLQNLGVPKDAWFVALHVRESTRERHNGGMNAVRNADIAAYIPAIAEITRRGGWVVRLGDRSMAPLPPMTNVIDYCHSAVRAEWMDIFLLGGARFVIATNSGPAFIPAIFGVPAVLTNWWPAGERPWQPFDIFVPKLLRHVSNGHYLTLSETLCEPLGWSYSRRFLASRGGVRVEDNDPAMIRDAVLEMLDRFDGVSGHDANAPERRSRIDRIYQSNDVAGMAQLPREFMRRYNDVLV